MSQNQIKYHKKNGNWFKLVITSTDITVVRFPAMETKKKDFVDITALSATKRYLHFLLNTR